MKQNDFFKQYGAAERHDELACVSNNYYVLFFGFGEDENGNFTWRKNYTHLPTHEELQRDINDLINRETDNKILNGFKWNGKPVYLSVENQMNFKTAYDLARDTDGATLPIKFKLGEDEDGKPIFHTFTKFDTLADFVQKAVLFVQTALNEGWEEKKIDYSQFDIED